MTTLTKVSADMIWVLKLRLRYPTTEWLLLLIMFCFRFAAAFQCCDGRLVDGFLVGEGGACWQRADDNERCRIFDGESIVRLWVQILVKLVSLVHHHLL